MGSATESPRNDRAMMTPAELAERLRLSPVTLSDWRHDGRGPAFVRLGHRTVRYRATDVEAWERARLQAR